MLRRNSEWSDISARQSDLRAGLATRGKTHTLSGKFRKNGRGSVVTEKPEAQLEARHRPLRGNLGGLVKDLSGKSAQFRIFWLSGLVASGPAA
jgi:hypothetical protein